MKKERERERMNAILTTRDRKSERAFSVYVKLFTLYSFTCHWTGDQTRRLLLQVEAVQIRRAERRLRRPRDRVVVLYQSLDEKTRVCRRSASGAQRAGGSDIFRVPRDTDSGYLASISEEVLKEAKIIQGEIRALLEEVTTHIYTLFTIASYC